MSENPFIRNPKDYKQHMNPLEEYIKQASVYVSKKLDISTIIAEAYVREALKKSDIKNPSVTYYERDDKLDKHKKKTSLLTYLNLAKKNKEIIVPSFTTYLNSSKIESFQKKFILGNLQKRKDAKKKMAEAKASGNIDDFIYFNVLQKVLKIFNNSLSGAYAIISTVLYNPSAHYTLTSITRSVASIGNAVSEMLVSGNRYYKDYDNTINAITATITHVDMTKIKNAIDKYGMYIPTAEEVFNIITYSSNLYWKSETLENKLFDYINKLTDVERAAVAYVNDFYHISKHNSSLARNIIRALSKRVTGYYYNQDYSVLLESDEFVINLAHHICMVDIEGIKVDYETLKNTEKMDALVSTVKNINNVLSKLDVFIDAFFRTDIMPINIADIKDMLRRAIVLSDTDSTCATYNTYVQWFFGADVQSNEATAVTAAVMTINTQVIDHFLKVLSGNMGVEEDVRNMLAMKNEFYWPVMVPTNVAKHYYAGVKIQEGVVFKEMERELKGVHLHANNIPKYFKDKAMAMIDDIQSKIANNEKLDMFEYVKQVIMLEQKITKTLYDKDPSVLKNGKVKEAKAYTLSSEESAYRYHVLWNNVFGDKYGTVDEPPYTTYELPVVFKNNTSIKSILESTHGSKEINDKLYTFIIKNFSGGLSTIKLPKSKIDGCGIPDELLPYIDIERAVEIIMRPFYIILETIGFYKKPNILVSDYYK